MVVSAEKSFSMMFVMFSSSIQFIVLYKRSEEEEDKLSRNSKSKVSARPYRRK